MPMLRRLVNEARLVLRLTATGPLLIKSGYATLTGPDMTPVLTFRNGFPQVFLPGSSLKGLMRSHIEKVIRTLRPDEIVVADTFAQKGEDQSCGAWFNEENSQRKKRSEAPLDNPTIYRRSDPVARLFGSTSYIGRVSIGDAYVFDTDAHTLLATNTVIKARPVELRDGVGINRVTGGAQHGAKFELEVVSAGTCFQTEILLRNFECWQLGAILLVVQDMQDGLLRVGSGKSRGLGAVEGQVVEAKVHHVGFDNDRPADTIWGLGHFLGDESSYGTYADDYIQVSQAPAGQRRGVRTVQVFEGTAYQHLAEQSIQEFINRMAAYPVYKQAL
jgi:CRISPR-associated RAMP protein (TIGR02581 family)